MSAIHLPPEQDESATKDLPPNSIEAAQPATAEDDSATTSSLVKLAHRIRTILGSKPGADKRADARRRPKDTKAVRESVARVEQVHWTEM